MSVDLKSITMFGRMSVVLMDDALIKLEHGHTQDRIRKLMFESIESMTITRKPPWVNIGVCTLFIALPGIGLLFVQEPPTTIIGIILILLAGVLIAWYLYCQQTTIRINRSGKSETLKGIFRPGKLRRFRDRLILVVRQAQESASGRASNAVIAPNDGIII